MSLSYEKESDDHDFCYCTFFIFYPWMLKRIITQQSKFWKQCNYPVVDSRANRNDCYFSINQHDLLNGYGGPCLLFFHWLPESSWYSPPMSRWAKFAVAGLRQHVIARGGADFFLLTMSTCAILRIAWSSHLLPTRRTLLCPINFAQCFSPVVNEYRLTVVLHHAPVANRIRYVVQSPAQPPFCPPPTHA